MTSSSQHASLLHPSYCINYSSTVAMAEFPAAILSPDRPPQRISLHELYRKDISYSRHFPSISSTPASQSLSSQSPVHSKPHKSRFKEDLDSALQHPELGTHKSEMIDPDQTESEVKERGVRKSKDEERYDSAVSGLDGTTNDAGFGDLKSGTRKKGGKRPARVPNTKGKEALAWLNKALSIIKLTSPGTKIDGLDGIQTQLWKKRLSKKFKRGLVSMYTGLETGALPHATFLPQIFGRVVGSSSLINAPFRAKPSPPNGVLEVSTCKKFPYENFIDVMRAAVEGRPPLSGRDSPFLLLPMKHTNNSFAPPNDRLHAKISPSNPPSPARTNAFKGSRLVQKSIQKHRRALPTHELKATNASLKSGMRQAEKMLSEDVFKNVNHDRSFRRKRNPYVKQNGKTWLKQSFAWAAFRIGRNIAGQSTHYDLPARHPFHDNQLLKALWEEARNAWVETHSGKDEEVLERAERHAVCVTSKILEDRRATRSEGKRVDNVVVRMGGCRRWVDMGWLVTKPKEESTLSLLVRRATAMK
ncbi:hypothetical protein N7G274_006585 [Stereocaulon virgatum]|uniref:Uncharacterized protein n=1 Tax=Stereocaulon virgatum TaxID=373712 RepID=A0ABR4A6Q7_9LECA